MFVGNIVGCVDSNESGQEIPASEKPSREGSHFIPRSGTIKGTTGERRSIALNCVENGSHSDLECAVSSASHQ